MGRLEASELHLGALARRDPAAPRRPACQTPGVGRTWCASCRGGGCSVRQAGWGLARMCVHVCLCVSMFTGLGVGAFACVYALYVCTGADTCAHTGACAHACAQSPSSHHAQPEAL